ncbi:aspartic peptidase domain-containing protein [Lipomyces arxii]|uniref:aspartic peptidase domain-containing protein n=1 Tax=Lipomyces arxii TaxID=56418 RepID=UPI0034CFB181
MVKSAVYLAAICLTAAHFGSSSSMDGLSFALNKHTSLHNELPHPALPYRRRGSAYTYQNDQIRLAPTSPSSVDLSHQSVVYTINVGVGTPPQEQTLLIDTDNSDIVVFSSTSEQCRRSKWGCGGGYNPLASSTYSNVDVNFVFGFANQSDTARGSFVKDDIWLGDYLVPDQQLALVEDSILDFDIQGVLGLGYMAKQQSDSKYETIASKLFGQNQQAIKPMFALYLDSRRSESQISKPSARSLTRVEKSAMFPKLLGRASTTAPPLLASASLDVGHLDSAKHAGDMLAFVHCTSEHDFSVRLSDLRMHNSSSSAANAVSRSLFNFDTDGYVDVLLDSGTIGILVPDSVADAMAASIAPTATYDTSLPGYRVACNAVSSARADYLEFEFTVAGLGSNESSKMIKVAHSEISRKLNTTLTQEQPDEQCMLDIVRESTYNIGNILGTAFLSSVYAVFDVDEHRVGLAQAAYYQF